MNIIVRNVDERAFRELKMKAVGEGLSLGRALTQAIYGWVKKQERPTKRPALLNFKPIRCGPGNENVSKEIDKIVYGVEL